MTFSAAKLNEDPYISILQFLDDFEEKNYKHANEIQMHPAVFYKIKPRLYEVNAISFSWTQGVPDRIFGVPLTVTDKVKDDEIILL